MTEKKSNHRVNVVRVGESRVHTNAEKLELFDIPGTDYQVVSQKGQFKTGDLGVYVQPDSVIPQTKPFEFIWGTYVGLDGTVPEKRRRITVRKFRGEWSEGLLLPVTDFPGLIGAYDANGIDAEGIDMAEVLGITHYVAPEPIDTRMQASNRVKWPPKTLKGWFYYLLSLLGLNPKGGRPERGPDNMPGVYDIEALKNYRGAFVDGEQVFATEKINGSNARYQFSNGKFYVGSHYQWKSPKIDTVWHRAAKNNPWIEEWCRAHEGWTLYGEVTPTQPGFKYGSDEANFFLFDVRSPEGQWDNKWKVHDPIQNMVPVVYVGPFDLVKLKELAEGPSKVRGATNIREGIVIQPVEERSQRGLGRVKLKLVSNKFLEKEVK